MPQMRHERVITSRLPFYPSPGLLVIFCFLYGSTWRTLHDRACRRDSFRAGRLRGRSGRNWCWLGSRLGHGRCGSLFSFGRFAIGRCGSLCCDFGSFLLFLGSLLGLDVLRSLSSSATVLKIERGKENNNLPPAKPIQVGKNRRNQRPRTSWDTATDQEGQQTW